MRALRPLPVLLLAASLAGSLAACDAGDPGSLYDPDAQDGPAPVIASVAPEGVVLAGIDEVTITGENFSATPEHNTVFFDDGAGAVARGTVLEATATALRVRVPNLPNPALRVRVSVRGAENFSNAVARPLTSAVVPFGNLDTGIDEDPRGVTSDATGALYVTLYRLGQPTGIVRFSPEGVRSDYSSQDALWVGLTPSADGALIAARQIRALFRIPEGSSRSTFAAVPSGASLSALATAPNGDVWAGGSNTTPENASLYRVAPDGTATAFPFAEPVTGLAATAEALYAVTATVDASAVVDSKLWRFPFMADGGIGEGDVLYDVTGTLGLGVGAEAVAVARDGTVFVGTNGPDPIVEVLADGTARTLYPGVIPSPITELTWAPGTKLYAVQGPTDPEEDPLGELITIETRRPGPF